MYPPGGEGRLNHLSDADLRDLAIEWEVENVPNLVDGIHFAEEPVLNDTHRALLMRAIREKESAYLDQQIELEYPTSDLPQRYPGAIYPGYQPYPFGRQDPHPGYKLPPRGQRGPTYRPGEHPKDGR